MSKIPLYLTLSRIMITFPVCGLIYMSSKQTSVTNTAIDYIAVLLFMIASITDYYDGYYARKLNAVTNLGKFLDPVADKILVSSLLIIMLYLNKIDPWMLILFIFRDTLIAGIRAAASADGLVIHAQTTGKWKAALQMVAIPFIMLKDLHSSFPNQKIGYGLLWFSVLLSLVSGWDYLKLYLKIDKA